MEALEVRNLLATFDVPLVNVTGQEQDPFFPIEPPDTVGAVGPDHFIQMVNSALGAEFAIYDKTDGSLVSGPTVLSSLAPLSSGCALGQGDPIVIYDQDAERFVMLEFGGLDADDNPDLFCVYISETSDPTDTTWELYEFDPQLFPDFPKIAFTGDQYIITTNDVNIDSTPSNFPAVYALDRENMLQGLPARPMQRAQAVPLAGFGFNTLTPADVDGPLPPEGSPGLALRHVDDELHFPSADPFNDFVEIYAYDIDFEEPRNSNFSLLTRVEVGEFDSDLCGGSFDCVPQPGTDIGLDALREPIMFRVQYRNFGTHETLVGNFTINTGFDRPGIRWFEMRKDPNNPASNWTLYQEGTVAPPDGQARWMGSIAMDGQGNIALGYNLSSGITSPSLFYTGRRASDPLGLMTQGEIPIVNGSGFFDAFANRWGDYSAMVVDPIDDTTFWFTGEYADDGFWSTQIVAFTFGDEIEPPIEPPGEDAGTISGRVWYDENGDGEIGDGFNGPVEDGLPRFHIYADLDEDGRFSLGVEPAAVTDQNGDYTLTIPDIPTDEAITVIVTPFFEPGWELTTPDDDDFIEVTIEADEAVTDVNFGYDLLLDTGSAPPPYPEATAGILEGFQLGDVLGLDDGFRIQPGTNIFAGQPAFAQFDVRNGGRPRGYVQMWMDFNEDGDWDDSGEQVILNERLDEPPGNPWQSVAFTVPSGVESGDYQTRVRYGYERFITAADPAQVGEIEDYELEVLGATPVAVNDFYSLPQGVANETLDVLGNDKPSSNGDIRIVDFTQPGSGAQVQLGTGGQSLRFTADPDFFSPPVLSFNYTIADEAVPPNLSTATVEIFIEATFENPIAVDDSFIVAENSEENRFFVLDNDIPGTDPPISLMSVSTPVAGMAEIDGDRILYTPADDFVGTDFFTYTIRDSGSPVGTSTGRVSVQVGDRPTADDKVIMTLMVTDTQGNDLTSTPVGSDFLLNVYVEDIRQPERFRDGVFAAFMDVLYDSNLASLVPDAGNPLGFEVTYGPEYGEGPTGSPAVPNIIDEFGTFSSSDTPIGDGPFLMASIRMTAEAAGLAEFKGDPADLLPESEVLLFGTNTPVAFDEVVYIFDELTITDGTAPAGRSPDLDTNNDDSVSPSDVLMVINFLNSNGPMALPNFASGGEGEAGNGGIDSLRELDTNADDHISSLDALLIINYLNGSGGGGEGEAGLLDQGEGAAFAGAADLPILPIDQDLTSVVSPEDDSEPAESERPRVAVPAPAVPVATPAPAAQRRPSIAAEPRDEEESLDLLLSDLAEDVAEAWIRRS